MPHAPLTADQKHALYCQGIALFNSGRYFEAHEVWEDIWHVCVGDERAFFQGLIQCAVALELWRRGRPAGVIALHKTYPPKFAALPPVYLGLEIAPFLAAMEQFLHPVLTTSNPPAFDPTNAPRINLTRLP